MKKEEYTWSRKNHSIYENFALDLMDFWNAGKKAEHGSLLIRNSLDKQKAYMKKNNLHMTYEMKPDGGLNDDKAYRTWKDDVYSNKWLCRSCELTRKIYHGDKQIFKDSENVNLYFTVTNALNGKVLENELYSCPNCGAISTFKQLEDMCPYCQTRFKMSDLFPKVTNYYTVKSFYKSSSNLKKTILKDGIPFMAVFFLWLSYQYNFVNVQSSSFLLNELQALIFAVLLGLFCGYLFLTFSTLLSGLKEAGKATSMLGQTVGSERKFSNMVKKYCPEFSYEYFTDKVVSILKNLLSEERIEDSPYFIGEPTDIESTAIIEYAFRGAVGLKKCRMDGTVCVADVDVFMTDYYWKNNKIHKKNDVFRISLKKDLAKKMNYHFSLAAIQCKSCGASFDIGKTKNCPHCDSPYYIGDDDWVVTAIRKK